MASKYGVYSTEPERVSVEQPIEVLRSLVYSQAAIITLDPGDTYVVPSVGDSDNDAVNKRLIYEIYSSTPGTAARTFRLPDIAYDGHIVIIKRMDDTQSVVNVVPFDGSDDIDGLSSVPLTFQHQAITLRAVMLGGGAYTWNVLSAYKPYVATMSFNFGDTDLGTIGGGGKLMLPIQALASLSQPVYASIYVTSNGATAGTFTVNVATGAETLATFVYAAGETGMKELFLTGLPITTNPIVAVGVVSSAPVDSIDFSAIVTYCCSLEV